MGPSPRVKKNLARRAADFSLTLGTDFTAYLDFAVFITTYFTKKRFNLRPTETKTCSLCTHAYPYQFHVYVDGVRAALCAQTRSARTAIEDFK